MKIIWFFLVLSFLLIPITISESSALQQIAGKIIVNINPGETKTFQWGLASDSDTPITLGLHAEGKGSKFLSFEKNITLQPRQTAYANFTVTIPHDHPGGIELDPSLYATQFGEQGGSTIINIQMLKIPSIIIAPNENPEFRSNTAYNEPTENQTVAKPEQKSGVTKSENPAGQTTIVQTLSGQQSTAKGGGCLIATAAFGSELAPQVQMLREIRDNQLLHTQSGTGFMTGFNSFYYSFSPTVADWERQNPIFKEMVKGTITPLITSLAILQYVPINSEATALFFGIGIILLNVGMYFVAPAVVVFKIKKHIMKK